MTMEPFFEPVRRTSLVRPRLELAVAPKGDEQVDWAEVQRAIQDTFRDLAGDVRVRVPSIAVKDGTARGGVVELFVFSSFMLPSRPSAEAIVVGVTFTGEERGLLITADVCGEESGCVYAREQPRSVDAKATQALARAASELAARVSRGVDVIVDAIRSSIEV